MKMKVIAHRGANREYPENSIEAFERALEIGVDGIETDLQLTQDGHFVVYHDDAVRISGAWSYIRDLTLKDLEGFDIGQGSVMPTLESLIGRFADRCPIVLDIKRPGSAEPLFNKLKTLNVDIRKFHMTSFLHAEIKRLRELDASLEGSISLCSVPLHIDRLCKDADTHTVSLCRTHVDEGIVSRLTEKGIEVRSYTVNQAEEARAFASWGVKAVYTDVPGDMTGIG